jgi:two-component system phosphate regulon sensor histidine kinase PhoR
MSKFRTRLALPFILLIGGSVLAAGVYTAVMIDRSHMNALRDSMKREMKVMLAAEEQMDDSSSNER